MTRVFVGGYAALAAGEFAERLTALGPLHPGAPSAGPQRPSWVLRSRDRRWVYAVSEVGEGTVVSLPADGTGPQSRVRSGGADPCHLALSPGGDLLVVSNYSSGTVGLLSVEGGALRLQDTVHLTGHGPHPRQRSPHAHQGTWLSDSEVVVCDLGSDSLVGLRVRPTGPDGAVPRLSQVWSVALPPGTGPRHLATNRAHDVLWVVGELDNTVHTLVRDPDVSPSGRTGGWSLVQSQSLLADSLLADSALPHSALPHSALPDPELPHSSRPHPGPGAQPRRAPEVLAAGIVSEPAGRHVYATVRGADVLVHLAADEDGRLTIIGHRTTASWPRFLGWLPGNRALVVAAERADQLQCFPVGPDGVPGDVAWTADWPQPTCVS